MPREQIICGTLSWFVRSDKAFWNLRLLAVRVANKCVSPHPPLCARISMKNVRWTQHHKANDSTYLGCGVLESEMRAPLPGWPLFHKSSAFTTVCAVSKRFSMSHILIPTNPCILMRLSSGRVHKLILNVSLLWYTRYIWSNPRSESFFCHTYQIRSGLGGDNLFLWFSECFAQLLYSYG